VRRDDQRLRDILESIERIERFAIQGRDAFDEDELLQVWAVHHLQVIGEAARALPDSLRSENPQVPWSAIIGMRHILVHDYFGIDLDEVWTAVDRDLPLLREQIEAILRSEKS
jgi:uncharacterized protein with HEPN domain